MKSKFKFSSFYLLVAVLVAGFGGQAGAQGRSDDSTSTRPPLRANTVRNDLPPNSPAGTQCGSLANGQILYAACQGHDLVGNPNGWDSTIKVSSLQQCQYDGGDSGSYTCPDGTSGAFYTLVQIVDVFIPYRPSAVDAYGRALVTDGPGWKPAKAACPPAYVLTQTSHVNILGDFRYTHSCIKT